MPRVRGQAPVAQSATTTCGATRSSPRRQITGSAGGASTDQPFSVERDQQAVGDQRGGEVARVLDRQVGLALLQRAGEPAEVSPPSAAEAARRGVAEQLAVRRTPARAPLEVDLAADRVPVDRRQLGGASSPKGDDRIAVSSASGSRTSAAAGGESSGAPGGQSCTAAIRSASDGCESYGSVPLGQLALEVLRPPRARAPPSG